MGSTSVPQDVFWQIANYEERAVFQPKVVVIHRKENQGFGFTLRHFVAYPPEEWTTTHPSTSAGNKVQAMETVFIIEVHPNGPAHLAGLKVGDRLLMVNNIKIAGIPYSTIVSIIKQTASVLKLQVVPKECDVLQMYYTEIAHNPETNRPFLPCLQPKPRSCILNQPQQQYLLPNYDTLPPTIGQSSYRFPVLMNEPTSERLLSSIRNNQITYTSMNSPNVPGTSSFMSPSSASSLSSTTHLQQQQQHQNQIDFVTRSLRKSIEQKEEFLKSPPSHMPTNSVLQREFYARPNRFVFPAWPPRTQQSDKVAAVTDGLGSPQHSAHGDASAAARRHQFPNKFITIENQENHYMNDGRKKVNESRFNNYGRDPFNGVLRMQQTSPEMKMTDKVHELKQNDGFNVVSELARQFECGRPLSPDNTMVDKTSLYKSELSRIKTKLAVPIVTIRKKELEMKMEKSAAESEMERHHPPLTAAMAAAMNRKREMYNFDNKDLLEYGKMDQISHLRDQSTVLQHANMNDRNFNKIETCDDFKTTITAPPRRFKTVLSDDDDDSKPMRRISYLKATGNETDCNFGLPASPIPFPRKHLKSPIPSASAPAIVSSTPNSTTNVQAVSPSIKESLVDSPVDQTDSEMINLEGEMNVKTTFFKSKKSQNRSWRPGKLELRGSVLKVDLGRDKKIEPVLSEALSSIDVRHFHVTEAEMTKRKFSFQLTSKPHRNEGTQVLFQAKNEGDYKKWMAVLHDISYGDSSSGDSITKQGTQSAEPQKVAASATVQTNVYCEENIRTYSSSGSSAAKSGTETDTQFGSSPSLKSRKGSTTKDIQDKEMGSPKTKNWKDLLFRKGHGHSDISSSTTVATSSPIPPVGSIGIPLKQCPMSKENEYVPYLVDLCTKIVESKGLNVVGIYRIPGNKAAISELTDQVNKNDISLEELEADSKWDDVNVVSSLLKLFIRSLPDALLPIAFYNKFIDADKKSGEKRLFDIKSLLDSLPEHSYETLKHIVRHLHRVSNHCDVNLMEPKNLAIIFGPSIVRSPSDTLETAVKDMKHQCRIVELLVSQYEYFFENGPLPKLIDNPVTPTTMITQEDQTNLLLDNVSKIEPRHTDKLSMSSRLIPHLRRRAHTKRSASASITSDTYSAESVMSFDAKKLEQRSASSFEYHRDKSERDSVDATSVLTDDESNQSRISDTGSMSLTTITDALDTKLRNLRSVSTSTSADHPDLSEKPPIGRHPTSNTFSQPLTMGEDIPYADESPERVLIPAKSTHLKNISRYTQSTSPSSSYVQQQQQQAQPQQQSTQQAQQQQQQQQQSIASSNYFRDTKTNLNHSRGGGGVGGGGGGIAGTIGGGGGASSGHSCLHEWCSDDSEVSTTSDPKDSLVMSPFYLEKCRKRRGYRLFRSASFNCRNYSSGRGAMHNHSALTKDEKTDMNITKKRQIQNKQNRSIKRRHTVGGPHDYSATITRRTNDDYNAILEVSRQIQKTDK